MRSPIRAFLDRRDDRRARALRARLGLLGWLASWSRPDEAEGPPGPWLARVSCRDWPVTLERQGPDRLRALRAAVGALERVVGSR